MVSTSRPHHPVLLQHGEYIQTSLSRSAMTWWVHPDLITEYCCIMVSISRPHYQGLLQRGEYIQTSSSSSATTWWVHPDLITECCYNSSVSPVAILVMSICAHVFLFMCHLTYGRKKRCPEVVWSVLLFTKRCPEALSSLVSIHKKMSWSLKRFGQCGYPQKDVLKPGVVWSVFAKRCPEAWSSLVSVAIHCWHFWDLWQPPWGCCEFGLTSCKHSIGDPAYPIDPDDPIGLSHCVSTVSMPVC